MNIQILFCNGAIAKTNADHAAKIAQVALTGELAFDGSTVSIAESNEPLCNAIRSLNQSDYQAARYFKNVAATAANNGQHMFIVTGDSACFPDLNQTMFDDERALGYEWRERETLDIVPFEQTIDYRSMQPINNPGEFSIFDAQGNEMRHHITSDILVSEGYYWIGNRWVREVATVTA